MLVAHGWEVNVKRVERLWRREGLRVPPPRSKASGQKALGTDEHALWNLPSTRQGHVWSYDFMSLRTVNGTGLRILNVIDEFTRVCVGSHVAYSIGAAEVRRALEQIFDRYGRPQMIRSDNGREFISTTLKTWLVEQGVTPIFVARASPQQNGYIERFNGSMRDEMLNREVFHSVDVRGCSARPKRARLNDPAWIDRLGWCPHPPSESSPCRVTSVSTWPPCGGWVLRRSPYGGRRSWRRSTG